MAETLLQRWERRLLLRRPCRFAGRRLLLCPWGPTTKCVSHSVAPDDSLRPHGLSPTRLLCPGDYPGKKTAVGCCHALLQGIFPTSGLNPGIPHRRQILYHLSHHGSPQGGEFGGGDATFPPRGHRLMVKCPPTSLSSQRHPACLGRMVAGSGS